MPSDLKYNNRICVLNALRNQNIATAKSIADRIGISRQTVTKSLLYFIEKGIVITAGKGDSTATGGKPPERYMLSPSMLFACFSLWPDEINITLFSLNGDIACSYKEAHELGSDPKKEIDYAADKCFGIMKDNDIDISQICAVSLSTAGIIDRKNGLLKYSSQSPEWGSGIPMEKYIRAHFKNIPVFLENSGKMTARPYLQDETLKDKRLLVIFACWGLSSCLIEKNDILNGKNSLIGEIGHMIIDPDDTEKCGCGGYGCLERLVSPQRLRKIIKQKAEEYPDSPLLTHESGIPEIFEYSKGGDRLAQYLARYAAEAFSLALRNISLVFDPDMVVFQGDFAYADAVFNQTLLTSLGKFRYYPDREGPFEIVYDKRALHDLDVNGSYIAVADRFFSEAQIYV